MIKLTLLLLSTIVWSLVWAGRRAGARKRLEEIDQGRRCIACHTTDTAIQGDSVRCQRCGHRWSLSAFRGARVSGDEIATITKPSEHR